MAKRMSLPEDLIIKNLIKVLREPDAPFIRKENYAMTYFSSACYFAEKGQIKQCLAQLDRAFKHGFSNKKLLLYEMEHGMLQQEEIARQINLEQIAIDWNSLDEAAVRNRALSSWNI